MTTPITHGAPILGRLDPNRTWQVAPPTMPPVLREALDDLLRARHLPAYLRHTGDPMEAAAVEAVQRAWAAHREVREQEARERTEAMEAHLHRHPIARRGVAQ